MNQSTLFEQWVKEAEEPFSGWDFSYISGTGRSASEPLPWSYASVLLPYFRMARRALDMGTGGGEFLTKMQPFPSELYATEGYEPNVPIARETLEPLCVNVVEADGEDELPFEDHMFGLVMNRHEAYQPSEMYRIIESGGQFITQQVGGKDNIELNHLLGANEDFGYGNWSLDTAKAELEKSGFEIQGSQEYFPYTRFYDVGAIVYFLKAIPWQIEDFSVDRYFDNLFHIHRMIEDQGYIDVHAHRFIIKAVKK
ncbi:class I SAM-dependent methyltransferase [Pontibacillus marinus]|uniref:SAM-dependent methyltransferase n=1 Tax=Pontibacillus marinus BH030004 = DSM 16465 TaxID=1385511 RepID=A0A0A5GAS6_9BACI|nr:methyltransferase domain-containing protein [Pontibacillus marinus]KGX90276.1 SAM-dependent methyltransferase [Pontibacillus marinus BH030004 = DSM 16465]